MAASLPAVTVAKHPSGQPSLGHPVVPRDLLEAPVGGVRHGGLVLFTLSAHAYAENAPGRPPVLAPTGLSDLDLTWGGIRAGDVWVVTGPPHGGRSMLCIQLAASLAAAGVPVRFFLGRDPLHETVSRLRSHTLGRRLVHSRSTSPQPDESWTSWALDFVPVPALNHTDDWNLLPGKGDCSLVVDDLDLWQGDPADFLDLARSWVGGPGDRAVVLTVPQHVLRESEPASWQRWVRGADVIAAIHPDGTGASSVTVLSHRAGPMGTMPIHDDFEHARLASPRGGSRGVPPPTPHVVPQDALVTNHDWDTPDPDAFAAARQAALAILADPATPSKVAAFYDPARNFAGATFTSLAPTSGHELTPSDLVAITLMNVSVQPAAVRRLLEPGDVRSAISVALANVPTDLSLQDADHAALEAAAALYTAIKDALRGNKWVTASKIAARKRPALIPVRDRVVVTELQLANQDFRSDWTILRALVRDEEIGAALRSLASTASSSAQDLTRMPALRLLDTAVWMHPRSVLSTHAADTADE